MGITTEYRIEEKYNHNILSVIFDSDSFFYAVSDVKNHLMQACRYSIDEDPFVEIPKIIENERLSGHYYSSVNIFSQISKFAFVPAGEYTYGIEDSIVKNSFDSSDCEITIDVCSEENLNTIHGYDGDFRQALSPLGVELNIRHISLPFIQNLRSDGVNVFVGTQSIFILVRKEGAFVLYNQYKTVTVEDRLYFIMLSLDQLGLDSKKVEVRLAGSENLVAKLHELLATYVANISHFKMGFQNVEDSSAIMDLYLASICE